jgi:hypothetical protein
MNRRNIILCVLLAICSLADAGDIIPKNVERRFNLEVFRILDEYEFRTTLSDNNDVYRFKALFASDSIEIFNDLMGLSEKPRIPLDEYIELLQQEDIKGRNMKIREVRKERVIDGDSVWLMDITFDKVVQYIHQKVKLYADKYYGEPYHITMRLSYPKNANDSIEHECKIVAINGKRDSTNRPPLPIDYKVILKESVNSKLLDNVTLQGRKLQFDGYNQMFVSNVDNLSYSDADVKMRLKRDSVSSHIYRLTFRRRHFRFKPHVEFSLGGYYKTNGSSVPYLETKSKDFTYGFDLGYTFPTKGKVRVGIFSGIGLSSSEVRFSIDSLNYSYNASPYLDVDGDYYIRHYEVRNMKQTINLKTVMLPVYLDFDVLFSKRFSAYLNIGAKAYFKLSNKVSSELEAYKYGVYPLYGNLRLDEKWGYNRFGLEKLGNESQERDFVRVKNTIDAFAGGGFRFLLYRQVYLDLGVQYQFTVSQTPIDMPHETISLRANGAFTPSPIVDYSSKGKERIHSVTGNFDGIKRNTLKLNVGLMLKF